MTKRMIPVIPVSALALLIVARVSSATFAPSGLTGNYFSNPDLTGTATLKRVDNNINFQWDKSPGGSVPAKKFSVRWTGYLTAPATGQYQIAFQTDAGGRVTLNGNVLVNDWGTHDLRSTSALVALNAGQRYPIVVDFKSDNRSAAARLYWITPGNNTSTIMPPEVLSPSTSDPDPSPSPSPSPTTTPTPAPSPTPTPALGTPLPNNGFAFLPGEATVPAGINAPTQFFCPGAKQDFFPTDARGEFAGIFGDPGVYALESKMWHVDFVQAVKATSKIACPGDDLFHIDLEDWPPLNPNDLNAAHHTSYASVRLTPKGAYAMGSPFFEADFSDKVLHATFTAPRRLVDGRWYEVMLIPTGDLQVENSIDKARTLTDKGRYINVSWRYEQAMAQVAKPVAPYLLSDGVTAWHRYAFNRQWQTKNGLDGKSEKEDWYPDLIRGGSDNSAPYATILPLLNGFANTPATSRNRFDVWISKKRIVVTENGFKQLDETFTSDEAPDFTRCSVHFSQYLYHSALRKPTGLDSRAWDDIGFRIESGFPTAFPLNFGK